MNSDLSEISLDGNFNSNKMSKRKRNRRNKRKKMRRDYNTMASDAPPLVGSLP